MFEKLLLTISQRNPLSALDIDLIKESFKPVTFSKNQIIEVKEQVPQYLYFIVSGYLRLFHFDDRGNEVTTHINCPPGFFTSYYHFINQTISHEYVECITDCELLCITKKDLDKLIENSENIKFFSITILQESILYNEKRAYQLAQFTAEKRYRKLIDEQPDILQNVPIQHIASFLGMQPESLSRIRRKVIS